MPDRLPPVASLDFRELFFSLPGSFLVLLADLTIVAATENCLRLLTSKREAVLGHNLFDVFRKDSDYL